MAYSKVPSIKSVEKKQPKKNRQIIHYFSHEGWKQFEKTLKKYYTTIK